VAQGEGSEFKPQYRKKKLHVTLGVGREHRVCDKFHTGHKEGGAMENPVTIYVFF
jgi:hypothetical protein